MSDTLIGGHESAQTLPAITHGISPKPGAVVLDFGFHHEAIAPHKASPQRDLGWISAFLSLKDPLTSVAIFNPDEADQWKWPRGLKWSDYPMILERRIVLKQTTAPIFSLSPQRYLFEADLSGLIDAADTFVVILGHRHGIGMTESETHEHLAQAYRFIRDVRNGNSPKIVVIVPGRIARVAHIDELAAETTGYVARARFEYSYVVNARAIIDRIVGAVINSSSDDSFEASRSLRGRSPPGFDATRNASETAGAIRREFAAGRFQAFLEPLGLQLLFKLRELTAFNELGLEPSRDGGFMRSSNGDLRTSWKGTGAHPAGQVETYKMARSLVGLAWLGMVKQVGDACIATDAGCRVLDHMHKDNEDPDAIIRWPLPHSAKDIEGMESWLLRHFRKMKDRIAAAGI